jgi:hypothetical protein
MNMETRLSRLLFRFDCPEPHVLGEYQLDLLDAEQRMRIAAHAAVCHECADELSTLRGFLADPLHMPETLGERLRRVVGSLVAPPRPGLALGGVRGTAGTSMRQYQAEDVTISIGPGAEAGMLLGLIVDGGERAAGGAVRLRSSDGPSFATTVDELGNFEFEGVRPGTYHFELELGDRLIVIENLQFD